MRYKCCEHILGSIDLSVSGFKYCNEVYDGPEYINYRDKNAFKKNEERRIEIINNMKRGLIPNKCQTCPLLQEKEWKEFDGIIYKLTIFNWKHCNAKCFYCSVNSNFYKGIKKSDDYDALPIINHLIEENRITSNTFVAFQGGEPTMLLEFPEILRLIRNQNCRIEILTNGIKYEAAIAETINTKEDVSICISLDCGSRELYKKIKGVDKFDEVLENIKKYINNSQENANKIRLKYIVLPNINDNKNEIDKFFNLCKELNIKTVSRTVNHNESKISTNSNKIIENSVIKAYDYFEKKTKKLKFKLYIEYWAEEIIRNSVYNCREISPIECFKSELHFLFGLKNN